MNIAFIDEQNLYYGTQKYGWRVDYKKFRIYLRDKYNIEEVYCFFGYVKAGKTDLYNTLQQIGYILQFKDHNEKMLSPKKGNIDVDLVFSVMKALLKRSDIEKIFIVSGDGDYYKLVNFLIDENKFGKILFPNKNKSSLYKSIGDRYAMHLSTIKHKIERLN
ncbi:MAG: NYN domain-containing protein [Candidatus Spechtbacteria bacterium SB0662_bin_43]|uniref:NYN domain-containing protein n=1 Tax=Candidatus Spechtbacteria bacterium SB0662_bin_43 TaxID=2604897 RepID=A0A845DB72_9BACT|nr:NYN domain-containing protein [Candidatus Spechtbacteria bacterium SB0662_bin_43]